MDFYYFPFLLGCGTGPDWLFSQCRKGHGGISIFLDRLKCLLSPTLPKRRAQVFFWMIYPLVSPFGHGDSSGGMLAQDNILVEFDGDAVAFARRLLTKLVDKLEK